MATEKEDDNFFVSFLFYDFLGYTTVHGAGRIVASRHWIKTLFWITLILGTLGVLTWQIHILYKLYEERPLTTHVAIQHDTSLDFPVLTICDMNALRKDELKNYLPESLRSQLTSEHLTPGEDEKEEEAEAKETVAEEEDEAEEDTEKIEEEAEAEAEENDEDEEDDLGALEAKFINKEYLRMQISEQNVDNLMYLGHQFEDFVIDCTFKGVHCRNHSSKFWNRFWHYAYGNCFVFNGGKTESGMNTKILKSNKAGPLYGLSLELNIEQDQYVGSITQEAGVRIDISSQGEMPFPFDKGLSLAPGYATSIGMRKVVIKRMDPLSKNRCMKDSALDDANIFKKALKVNYSSIACKESCLAFNQRKACGCMQYRFTRPVDTNVCNVLNKTVARCIDKVQKNFTENKLNCSHACPPPCRESTYKLTTSYSFWPTTSYEAFYKGELKKRSKEVDGSNNFRANVLKLDVFFEELNFEVISEEPSYGLANFVSDLGGSLGLWIGMSVLSFAEIVELLMLTCYALGRKFNRRITGGKVQAFAE